MKNTVAVTVLLGTSILQACSTPYVQPEGRDVGVLTVKNNVNRPVVLQGFKNAADCSGGKIDFTADGSVPAFGKVTIKVKPDEPFSFYVTYNLVGTYCNLPATYTPRAGGQYTVNFSVDLSERKCYMPMTERTELGEQREASFKLRQWQTPFAESGSFCK